MTEPEDGHTTEADLAEMLRLVLNAAGASTRAIEAAGGPPHQTVSRMRSGRRLRAVRAYVLALEVAGYEILIRRRRVEGTE